MFRERLNEEKKRLGITAKSVSAMAKLHTPEETISRVLSGKTSDPGVCTVLDIGEAMGLAPYEIFMDATLAAEFRAFLDLKSRSDETEAERIRLSAENDNLKITNVSLSQKIEKLEAELEHKKEIIALHEYYNKRNQQ